MRGILLALMISVYAPTASALTIATGPTGGSYFQIAQDISNVVGAEGIDLRVMATRGSFENLELLYSGNVDLAIVQLDAVRAMGYSNARQFISDVAKRDPGMDGFEKVKVVLNLYPEEIHILTKEKNINTFNHLEGKRVSVGPPGGGTAVTAVVLFNIYGIQTTVSEEPFEEAVKKLERGSLDAVIFVGGAPVPFIGTLGGEFKFVRLPTNPALEQIYSQTAMGKQLYSWAREDTQTYAVPSAIMGLDKRDEAYVAQLQRLVLTILNNRENLEASGHPKWKSSTLRTYSSSRGYEPTNLVIQMFNVLDKQGYKLIKK
jgi:TRAP transporter TAXI family solute receptor